MLDACDYEGAKDPDNMSDWQAECSDRLEQDARTVRRSSLAQDGRDTVVLSPAYAHRFTAAATRAPNFRVSIDVGRMSQSQGQNSEPTSPLPTGTSRHGSSQQTPTKAGRRHSKDSQLSTASKRSRRKKCKMPRASVVSSVSLEVAAYSSQVEGSRHMRRGSTISSAVPELIEYTSDESEDDESDASLNSIEWSEADRHGKWCSDASRYSKHVISGGADYHTVKSRTQVQQRAIKERRPALVSGLDLLPYFEQDPTFLNFETVVRSEACCVQRPQLKRARAHYKKTVERFPTNYVALVNLACCHALLNEHADALPLLRRAISRNPEKGAAHVNQVLCLVKLQDNASALAAIERTFSIPSSGKVAELSKSQKSLLLRCKAAIYFRSNGDARDSQRAMQLCCEAAVAAAVEDPIDAPHETRCGGAAIVNKHGDIVGEGFLRAELHEGIQTLKSSQEDEYQKPQKPPWGRRYLFGVDETKVDLAGQQGMHKWCHLRPDQIEELRTHLKQPPSQRGHLAEPTDRGKAAFETARVLTFFNRLEPQHAVAILNLAELLEIMPDEYVFRQGDVAEFMYVIAMGSVHIVVTDPTYGPYPVTLDTFYDGQSFGESAYAEDAEVSTRRASVVAQEACVLLRFRPADYRSVIGAVEKSDLRYTSHASTKTVESSDELMLHRGDALQKRMEKLKGVPCFEPCSEHQLTLLASNAQELRLRYGDVVVRIGDAPRGCFVISDGYFKVFVSAEAEQRPMSARDRKYNSAEGRSPLSGDETMKSQVRTKENNGEISKLPCGSAAAAAMRLRTGSKQATSPHSSVHASRHRGSVVKQSKDDRTARRPGTPRARTPWVDSLRGGKPSFCKGNRVTKEVDLGYLSPGDAFGLGAMFDFREHATATVVVDSDVAQLLVLTQRSLLYLPDTLVTTVMEKCKDMVDPARPTINAVRGARTQQRTWAAVKQKLLTEEMTTVV